MQIRLGTNRNKLRGFRTTLAGLYLLASVAALSAPAAAFDVTDQRGRSVTFDKPPQRLVFVPIPGPATFISIDGSERKIVGMNGYSASAMREGLLGKMFPGFTRISTNVVMGATDASVFDPNVEGILALKPDVVFQWATSASGDVIGVLDRTGVPVLGMRAGSQEDLAGFITMIGQVSGNAPRATELLARQDKERHTIEAAMSGLTEAQRPRVIYFNRAAQTLRVAGRNTNSNYYIHLVGGQNVAADSPPQNTVTIEQVLTWNPQVILLGNFDAAMPSDIYADPRWQSIDAVKNRRVYKVPLGGYRWDPPSQESALMWVWLAGLLQPDREPVNLRAVMRDWYGFLYQHDLSDDEIDGILFAAQNRQSAGYDRYLAR
ncbi:ABC transporter substrate-binding protein [Bradyrhizobium sp. dw_78]|uniref:ABC transporter substrate-binding protein n=1 Tax=Bradyrhizobium sp. dw_78 TaxID=2719793 RepID=UPI001BD57432|nr:ABC transporter substrate-binding protein [Bradyrhizobium sp. dw_78]